MYQDNYRKRFKDKLREAGHNVVDGEALEELQRHHEMEDAQDARYVYLFIVLLVMYLAAQMYLVGSSHFHKRRSKSHRKRKRK
tara:strand:- start:1421 stop:1669 length:249 start_codon:yes stop_codon:yes gene_type:complete